LKKFSESDTQPKIPPGALIISSICRFVLQFGSHCRTECPGVGGRRLRRRSGRSNS